MTTLSKFKKKKKKGEPDQQKVGFEQSIEGHVLLADGTSPLQPLGFSEPGKAEMDEYCSGMKALVPISGGADAGSDSPLSTGSPPTVQATTNEITPSTSHSVELNSDLDSEPKATAVPMHGFINEKRESASLPLPTS